MNDERTLTTVQDALAKAARILQANGILEPRRTAQSLLAFVTGRDRTRFLVHPEATLTDEELAQFRETVRRRGAGEPLQYITGRQEFFGLEFEVTPAVLIPRPETELIVEAGLKLLDKELPSRFCDVGTGSGCITVALLHNCPHARGIALDISESALAIARRNAMRHGVAERSEFVMSDVFADLAAVAKHFDLIVSNPPYIAEDEVPTLQREVRDHEPRGALTPGGDGLGVVRRLLDESSARLVPGGHLVFEIGYGQEAAVRRLIDPRAWQMIEVRADLQGIARIFILRRAN